MTSSVDFENKLIEGAGDSPKGRMEQPMIKLANNKYK